LLGSAIAKLRRDGDPERALALLDRYRAEFPSPALGQEEAATRIEALLRLGRNGPALALLDTQSLSARGVDREMLVARAELRASKGRCPAALHDFDQVLSVHGQNDSMAERALFGRAGCRAKGGDLEGARGDYQQYVKGFPHGRFASQARAALGDGPAE
jgi:TolA-binding protein